MPVTGLAALLAFFSAMVLFVFIVKMENSVFRA